MTHKQPSEVVSPKARWKLIAVLYDGGAGEIAYAVGEWDGRPRIGVRWNGDAQHPIGNPQSRGLPTWTMLDPDLYLPVIQKLPEDEQLLARKLLKIETYPVIEMKIDHHPSGRYTLKKRVSGQRNYDDCVDTPRLFGNLEKADFLEAYCGEVKKHLQEGARVILQDF